MTNISDYVESQPIDFGAVTENLNSVLGLTMSAVGVLVIFALFILFFQLMVLLLNTAYRQESSNDNTEDNEEELEEEKEKYSPDFDYDKEDYKF